jgi:hypothetical protein
LGEVQVNNGVAENANAGDRLSLQLGQVPGESADAFVNGREESERRRSRAFVTARSEPAQVQAPWRVISPQPTSRGFYDDSKASEHDSITLGDTPTIGKYFKETESAGRVSQPTPPATGPTSGSDRLGEHAGVAERFAVPRQLLREEKSETLGEAATDGAHRAWMFDSLGRSQAPAAAAGGIGGGGGFGGYRSLEKSDSPIQELRRKSERLQAETLQGDSARKPDGPAEVEERQKYASEESLSSRGRRDVETTPKGR